MEAPRLHRVVRQRQADELQRHRRSISAYTFPLFSFFFTVVLTWTLLFSSSYPVEDSVARRVEQQRREEHEPSLNLPSICPHVSVWRQRDVFQSGMQVISVEEDAPLVDRLAKGFARAGQPVLRTGYARDPNYYVNALTRTREDWTSCPSQTETHEILLGARGFYWCPTERRRDRLVLALLQAPAERFFAQYEKRFRRKTFFGKKTLGFWLRRIEEGGFTFASPAERVLRYAATEQTRLLCGYDCLEESQQNVSEMLERALRHLTNHTHVVGVAGQESSVRRQLDAAGLAFLWSAGDATTAAPLASSSDALLAKMDPRSKRVLEQLLWADAELYRVAMDVMRERTRQADKCLELVETSAPIQTA